MFYMVKELKVMLGQAMRSCAIPEQSDVAERGVAISLFTIGYVGDGLDRTTVDIFRIDPQLPVAPTGYPLGGVEVH